MPIDNETLGAAVAIAKANPASEQAITNAVNDWLDDHPEATTTVQDGSITKAKLENDLQVKVDELSQVKSAIGYGFYNGADYTGDANDLGPGVSRVTASVTHIPVAQVGYVITFARTETTAKSQIYINAPIGTYTGRCHLYARYLVSGAWSAWVDFADNADLAGIPAQAWTHGTDYSADLDDAPAGVSRVLGNAAHNPSGEMGYILTIIRAASAKAQIFITNNALYFRMSSSGTWSAWGSTLKSSTDRAVGYTFGDSLMAQDGKAFAYPNPQYNSDEIGETCVGWQTLLAREFGVSTTNLR